MRLPDEVPPPSPLAPPVPSPASEQSSQQLEQQTRQDTCCICQEDIASNEAVTKCRTCRAVYHTEHLTAWLTTRLNAELQRCPNCRSDMRWVLGSQLITVVPTNLGNNIPLGLQPTELLLDIHNWNWEIWLP